MRIKFYSNSTKNFFTDNSKVTLYYDQSSMRVKAHMKDNPEEEVLVVESTGFLLEDGHEVFDRDVIKWRDEYYAVIKVNNRWYLRSVKTQLERPIEKYTYCTYGNGVELIKLHDFEFIGNAILGSEVWEWASILQQNHG